MSRGRGKESFPCPACGEAVPAGAPSCKACGADAKTGWEENDELAAQELDLPRPTLDDDEYADFLHDELGGEDTRPRRTSNPTAWILIVGAIVALATFLALLTGGKP